MGQIAREDEKQREDEVRAVHRQEVWRKVRKGFFVVALLSMGGYAYAHREQLEQRYEKMKSKATTAAAEAKPDNARLGDNLKSLQSAAQKRDDILDSLTKK
jgi:hypothetical protein